MAAHRSSRSLGPPLKWYYKGDDDIEQGPYSAADMQSWLHQGYFSEMDCVRTDSGPIQTYVPIKALGHKAFFTRSIDASLVPSTAPSPVPSTPAPTAAPSGGSAAAVKDDASQKETRMRRRVAEEILSTERTYVTMLQVLERLYVTPVTSGTAPFSLSPQQSQLLFSNVTVIGGLNAKLLSDISERFEPQWSDDTCIGDLFLQFIPFFKMYQLYINNYGAALGLVATLMTGNKKFAAFVEKQTKDPSAKGEALESLLIMPVQRIPRYKLLLSELLKHTPATHKDHSDLSKALETISNVAKHINEAVKDFENRQNVWTIQKQFSASSGVDINLMAPHRQYVRKGTLTKLRPNQATKQYDFFLFSDLLVYASKQALGRYKMKRRLVIDDWFFVDPMPSDRHPYAFQLISTDKCIVVFADTESDMQQWLDAFDDCIEQNRTHMIASAANSSKAREAEPEDPHGVTACRVCERFFGPGSHDTPGRLKFHCRLCGRIVCDQCARSFHAYRKDTHGDPTKYRSCDTCMGFTAQQLQKLSVSGPNPTDSATEQKLIQVANSLRGLVSGAPTHVRSQTEVTVPAMNKTPQGFQTDLMSALARRKNKLESQGLKANTHTDGTQSATFTRAASSPAAAATVPSLGIALRPVAEKSAAAKPIVLPATPQRLPTAAPGGPTKAIAESHADSDDDEAVNEQIGASHSSWLPSFEARSRGISKLDVASATNDASLDPAAEITKLRAELTAAIAAFRYDRCAALRARIAVLEQAAVQRAMQGQTSGQQADAKQSRLPPPVPEAALAPEAAAADASEPIELVEPEEEEDKEDNGLPPLCGWLDKSGRWSTHWKPTFAQLNPQQLSLLMSSSPGDAPHSGIPLRDVLLVDGEAAEKLGNRDPLCFALHTARRTHWFRAATAEDVTLWKQGISEYTSYSLQQGTRAAGMSVSWSVQPRNSSLSARLSAGDSKDASSLFIGNASRDSSNIDTSAAGPVVSDAGYDEHGVLLPEHWYMYRDDSSGFNYYMHAVTGESTWERPV